MATTTQLLARIAALESKLGGTQNNANGARAIANAALPKTGGNTTGGVTFGGAVNVNGQLAVTQAATITGDLTCNGEMHGDFQGTINGHSLSGSQVLFLQGMGMMSHTNDASGTLASVTSQFNILLGKLRSAGYSN